MSNEYTIPGQFAGIAKRMIIVISLVFIGACLLRPYFDYVIPKWFFVIQCVSWTIYMIMFAFEVGVNYGLSKFNKGTNREK